MAKFKFTPSSVARRARPAKGNEYHYDTETTGLALRISHTGRRTFLWQGRIAGVPKRITLQVDNVADAKREVTRLLDTCVPLGVADYWTLGQLQSHWMENYAKRRKRTWKRDIQRFELYLSDWSNIRIGEITRAAVMAKHNAIHDASGPYAANDTLAYVKSLYRYAIRFDYSGRNPADMIDRFSENERKRYLQPSEIPPFFAAVNSLSRSVARDFFLLALWTGQRRQCVLSMRWDELNLASRTWTIPPEKDKSKSGYTVHLSDPALQILNARRAFATSEYVLESSQSISGHYTEPKAAWAQVCKRAGLRDIRIHDLRRTLGSWMANGSVSLPIIARALGHSSTSATEIYARIAQSPVAAAVNAAADAIQEAANAVPPENGKKD